MAAPEDNVFETDEMLVAPGTYFNPQTEVVVIVDDSVSLDQDIFNLEAYEGADWVRIGEEVPVDEDRRDHIIQEFQSTNHPGSSGAVPATEADEGDPDTPPPPHVGDTGEDEGGAPPPDEEP
jgi:hypothetical protein